jgi:hypothetical protein
MVAVPGQAVQEEVPARARVRVLHTADTMPHTQRS